MPRLFKRSHRYNVAKNCFLARIILLDNTNIEFNLLPEVTGADCLEKVAQVLVIQEVSCLVLLVPEGDTGVVGKGDAFLVACNIYQVVICRSWMAYHALCSGRW